MSHIVSLTSVDLAALRGRSDIHGPNLVFLNDSSYQLYIDLDGYVQFVVPARSVIDIESCDADSFTWTATLVMPLQGPQIVSVMGFTEHEPRVNYPGGFTRQTSLTNPDDIQGGGDVTVTSVPPNKVVNESATPGEAWAQWRVAGNAFLRGYFTNEGKLYTGTGNTEPILRLSVNSKGQIELPQGIDIVTTAEFRSPANPGQSYYLQHTSSGTFLFSYEVNDPVTNAFISSTIPFQILSSGRIIGNPGNSDPTTARQLTEKAYVDAQDALRMAVATPAKTNLTLTVPWANVATREVAGYRRHGNIVHLHGRLNSGASAWSATIVVAAAGIIAADRPTVVKEWNILSSNGATQRIRVGTDGAITLLAAPAAAWEISLDGLYYFAGT